MAFLKHVCYSFNEPRGEVDTLSRIYKQHVLALINQNDTFYTFKCFHICTRSAFRKLCAARLISALFNFWISVSQAGWKDTKVDFECDSFNLLLWNLYYKTGRKAFQVRFLHPAWHRPKGPHPILLKTTPFPAKKSVRRRCCLGKACERNESVRSWGEKAKWAQASPAHAVQTWPVLGLLSQISVMGRY